MPQPWNEEQSPGAGPPSQPPRTANLAPRAEKPLRLYHTLARRTHAPVDNYRFGLTEAPVQPATRQDETAPLADQAIELSPQSSFAARFTDDSTARSGAPSCATEERSRHHHEANDSQ
jgi:hypothetical protein